ncbi:dihydroneopterin aldolase [Erythrobacter litoralis]|uniref:Dihydroneopterin aldolase/epimerase domain-containing protein n=1 Tax=Erythrobacter litoralis (strain HTCC2594) TaxID=314225 RepID=Q2NCE5_ERYLH|nr:dihydroneopterin aldolase [Erythrobacter litoralis]ABC62646.1 hypothetical protein ELI_02770 [Erythrobacter litoralis HTCC2594]
MADALTLEFDDIEHDVLTGIYSEETGRPQPLRISIAVDYKVADRYDPDTPLEASKNYMDLKFAATEALPEGLHFKLIESLADHICETLFLQDEQVLAVTVKIVKLAIAEKNEKIGITLRRERR